MTVKRSDGFLRVALNQCNSFSLPGSSKKTCIPFFVGNKQVGLIRPDIWQHLQEYAVTFHGVYVNDSKLPIEIRLAEDSILIEDNSTKDDTDKALCELRTKKVDKVLRDLRRKNVFYCLKGWREESYNVYKNFGETPLMRMERSAVCLFGVKQYGVRINGYTKSNNGEVKLWVAQRAKTKPTWPLYYDNMAAGGLSSGLKIMECAKKECEEEASVPDTLTQLLKPVGTVSFFYEDETGLLPQVQFVMDLELPANFVPQNADGEVEKFQLIPVEELKDFILRKDFKPTSALIIMDFMFRHGLILPDEEPNYSRLLELMHVALP